MDAFCTEKHLMQTLSKKSKQKNQTRKNQARKGQLGVENLESRFNLSAAAGIAASVVELQAARLSSTSQQGTMNKVKPLSVNLSSLSSTASAVKVDTTSLFGDTSLSGSSTTSVPVSDYSSISNARVEYRLSTPNIGFMASSGVSIAYKVNAPAAGNYKIEFGVAGVSSMTFDLGVNSTWLAAQFGVNSTGGWDNYTKTSQTIYLGAGANTINIRPTWGSQFNINSIALTPSNVTPTNTTTPPTTTTTNNTSTTSASNVTSLPASGANITADKYSAIYNSRLEYTFGVADIGYVQTSGSWVEYTVNVQQAGSYKISPDMASPANSSLDLSVNGGWAATYSINGNGSWSNFQAPSNNVYLDAGNNVLRFSSKNGTQYNLGTIRITQAYSTTTTTPPNTTTNAVTTPQAPASWSSGSVSIGTQWMTSFNQLNVTGTSGADNIYVSQSGDTITITANGQSTTYSSSSYGDIVIKGGDGNDSITVDSSVRANVRLFGEGGNDTLANKTQGNGTVVSIGGGYDVVSGNGWSTSLWGDSSDTVSGGNVHSVSGFWGGVSTELWGQNFSDPAGTGSTTRLNNSSLWGTGPQITDVTQGLVSDCFLLAPLQTMANNAPSRLRELAVDLGDGTYAVQFKRGGTTTYVRVDGDLPAGGYYQQGINYAHPGASGNQWMPIIEKAYAEFRTGAWNYNSLNYGNFNSVLSDFGQSVSGIGGDANTEFNQISGALAAGRGVTYGTINGINSGAPLIAAHTYTVTSAWRDGSGVGYVTMRNPWGYDGAGWDSNTSDGYVTLNMYQLQSNMMAGSILV